MKRLAVALALLSSTAAAQAPPAEPETRPREVWAGGGLGFQSTPLFAGAGAHLSAVRGATALRVGYDGAEEFTLGATPSSMRAVSLSAEVRTREGIVHLSAYAGPAVVWGLGRPENGVRTRYQTTGLAVGGAVFVELGPGFGLGVDVSGNVNPEIPSVGVRLAAHARLK